MTNRLALLSVLLLVGACSSSSSKSDGSGGGSGGNGGGSGGGGGGAGGGSGGGSGGAGGAGGGAGQGGGGGSSSDAAADKAADSATDSTPDLISPDIVIPDLPPGCPPASANDKGVGKPCTMGGNQCQGNMSATQCTCDPIGGVMPPANTPCFCTVFGLGACSASVMCGTSSHCCEKMAMGITAHLCIPDICLDSGMCPP